MKFKQRLIRREAALILLLTDAADRPVTTTVWDRAQPYACETEMIDGVEYLVLKVPVLAGIDIT